MPINISAIDKSEPEAGQERSPKPQKSNVSIKLGNNPKVQVSMPRQTLKALISKKINDSMTILNTSSAKKPHG